MLRWLCFALFVSSLWPVTLRISLLISVHLSFISEGERERMQESSMILILQMRKQRHKSTYCGYFFFKFPTFLLLFESVVVFLWLWLPVVRKGSKSEHLARIDIQLAREWAHNPSSVTHPCFQDFFSLLWPKLLLQEKNIWSTIAIKLLCSIWLWMQSQSLKVVGTEPHKR